MIFNHLSIVLMFLLDILFYGFIISLFFVSIINRYLSRRYSFNNNDVLAKHDSSSEAVGNSVHTGVVGILGRTILSYIRFTSIIIGFIPLHCIRVFLYKHVFFMKISNDVYVHYGLTIMGGDNIEISSNSIIGDKCTLDGRNGLYIGKNVNFSSGVNVYTEQHDYKNSMFASYSSSIFSVKINDYAWIGPNVIILPGVTIGEGAVIGAGSVVTKDIEPYTLSAGVPAKYIAERPKNLRYKLGSRDVKFY